MNFDIYGNRLARGHCEVHPHVHQEYPCDLCLPQRSPKRRAPAVPMCGICGEHEACADSCGVAVCSEACCHEARRRHDEPGALRARIVELEASNAELREALQEIEERTRPNGDMADSDVNLVARAALGER